VDLKIIYNNMDVIDYLGNKQNKKKISGRKFTGRFVFNGDNNTRKMLVAIVYYVIIIIVGWFLIDKSSVSVEFAKFVYALVFFGLIPWQIIRKGYGERLEIYNWPVGYAKKQLIFSFLITGLTSLLIWLFMLKWGGGKRINQVIWLNAGMLKLVGKNLIILPIGLLAQEFFFRGFLLNSLRRNLSGWLSVFLVALLVALFNWAVGRVFPGWLALGGVVFWNVLLGWLVVRFRSVIFSLLFYWLGIVVVNFWFLWQLGRNIG
jgi:membrane protease YdiL (CAAX protease family)